MTENWHLIRGSNPYTGWGDLGWGDGPWGGGFDPGAGDPDLEEVHVRDGIGAFSNKAEVVLDDPDGSKPTEYPRPTLIELWVEIPGYLDPMRRFAGFVQDHSSNRNETELTVLSHDFWIRKATGIYAEFENELVSTILEELITRETPLIWNPDLIDLENDETISRRWAGEALEQILEELQTISGGEEFFGATFDREFYFQPLGDEGAPRSFGVGEYLDAEWDEDGKHAANRAIVRYGEGEDQAVVAENNRTAQRDLQEALGADSPVEIPIQENRPEITTEDRARDKARQLLEDRSELQSGEIETWEAFRVEPGQITSVVDPNNDVDDEFRVVQMEYEWPGEPTVATVADRSMDTVDELVSLSDAVQRQELQDADPDAPFLETLLEHVGATLELSATVTARLFGDERFTPGFGRDALGFNRDDPGIDVEEVHQASTDRSRVTNASLNAIRDAWQGGELPSVTKLLVGAGDSSPSGSDTELEDELAIFPATIWLSGMGSIRWTGVTRFDEATDLEEVGLSNDDLWGRVTLDNDIEVPALTTADVSARLEIADDPEFRGDLEAAGAEAIRDIITDNDPSRPAQFRFVAVDGEDSLDVDIDQLRTRGTGQLSATSRLDQELGDGRRIEAISQIDDEGTALVTNEIAPLEITAFDLEVTQRTRFSNQ